MATEVPESDRYPRPLSRRTVLGIGGLVGGALLVPAAFTGCEERAGPTESGVLRSRARLPAPYGEPLRIPPRLQPVRTDATTDFHRMTVKPAKVRILPGLTTTVWGYEGGFPGPTVHARRGRTTVIDQRNDLPVPVVTHLHGGRTPADSDGYPTDLLLPASGTRAVRVAGMRPDPHADIAVGSRRYTYPNDQPASTLWYHDHRMGFTGPQVWRGLAGFYLVHDDVEAALPLPDGDRDIPLLICDRAFDEDGSLRYPAVDPDLRERPGVTAGFTDGVRGDVTLVNGVPWPYLEVAAVRYRFRILNAANARRYELTLSPPPADGGAAFTQIGSDCGLLGAPVPQSRLVVAPAERADVVIDFSRYAVGSTILLRNGGAGEKFGDVMCFRVTRAGRDDSAVPARLAEVAPLATPAATVRREFAFAGADTDGHTMWTVNGAPFDATTSLASPALGSTEIWRLQSDADHPIHLHLVRFQVLSRAGGLRPQDVGWKDTVDLAAGDSTEIAIRFDGYRGRYVIHCHNLEHEDMAMMATFTVV